MDSRKRMGKDKDGVIFPVAPNLSEMSDSYLDFIEAIKKEIENQRLKVVLNANSSMICLYWNIGKAILQKQEEEGWGAKVIDRMAKDLKDAFPDMSGFSPRNLPSFAVRRPSLYTCSTWKVFRSERTARSARYPGGNCATGRGTNSMAYQSYVA